MDNNVRPLQWQPTSAQRRAKARFWSAIDKNPMLQPEALSVAKIAQITQTRSIETWLADPMFKDWLLNREHEKQLIQASVESAIKRLVEIVETREVGPREAVTAATQVKAAELLLNYGGYAPASRKVVEYKDKDIEKMDEAQLRAYIAERTKSS